MTRQAFRLCLVGVASLFAMGPAEGSARAQGNDLSAPSGGRSALMGNTGVALSRDGSAPILNPATIVRIDDNSLAFSVNFYTFASTSFSHWHQPAPVDTTRFGDVGLNGTSISTNGFRIFPSTLCLFFTVRGVTAEGSNDGGLHGGRQKLAICFGSTEFEDVVLPALSFRGNTPLGMTAQTQSVARNWNRFHAGPTYSISFGDNFAVGLSLHGVYTTESFVPRRLQQHQRRMWGRIRPVVPWRGRKGAIVRLRGDSRSRLSPRRGHARSKRRAPMHCTSSAPTTPRSTTNTASRASIRRRSPAATGTSPPLHR